MSEREPTGGEIDFSDGELAEMGVELAGREGAQPAARKSRSMLRVPVDEVPRPQGGASPATSTEPSLPVLPEPPPDPADDVVEHAFRNGGLAEGEVPATLHLAAAPAKDELEIFSAQLLAERDRDRLIEVQMEEADTDPKALAHLRAAEGVVPQPIDEGPTRQVRATPPSVQPRLSPALAALARAVTVPPADRQWLAPTQATQETDRHGDDDDADAIWSSAPPPPESRRAGPALSRMQSPPVVAHDAGETDDMELDDGELEEVEQSAAPPRLDRQRLLTPVVPPPPLPLPDGDTATHAIAVGAPAPTPSTNPPAGAAPGPGPGPSVAAPHAPPASATPHAPPAMPPSVSGAHPIVPPLPPSTVGPHAIPPAPPPATISGQHAVIPPLPSAAHAMPPLPPSTSVSSQHVVTPPAAMPPAPPPPSAPQPPSHSGAINVNANGAAANGASAPPPAPAPVAAPPPSAVAATAEGALRPRRKRRAKQWFEEIFDDDYLRTLPFLTPRQTEREARFVADSLQIPTGGALLDLACGYGRHAMELAANGYKITGLDLSLPLLIRAADAARRVGVNVNFIHGDMREMSFDGEFDGAYCMFTSFGYFDDDTNRKVAANLARAIKPGGKLLLDVVNRDYLVRDLPTRVWWQGDGCVVLEEVDFNYFSSRLQVQRSIIFEDGRQVEQEISIRAYSLHEIGKVLHHSGFRVTEVSGGLSLRGKFFGADSRQLIVVAEKKLAP